MWRAIITWAVVPLLLLLVPAAVLALEGHPDSPLEPAALIGKALRAGDRGEAVNALQQALQAAGFDPGKIDGIFGPRTEGAVKQAQESLGLAVDGKAGYRTVSALAASDKAATSAPDAAPSTAVGPAATDEPAVTASEGRLTVISTAQAVAANGPKKPSSQLIIHQPAVAAVATPEPSAPATAGGRFALTFNGDPDPVLLPRLLETLQKHGAHATFFVTSEAAIRHPELLRSIVGQGHSVGSNGPDQLDLRRVAPVMMETRLHQSRRAIAQITGAEPAFFRPPAGVVSTPLSEAAARTGMATVLWTNVTVTDTPGTSPLQLARRLEGVVYDGAVLMLHQDRPGTVVAVDLLLQNVAGMGWTIAPLSTLAELRQS